MSTDKELDEILAEIGREHRAVGPPDRLEPLLRSAAGGKKSASGAPRLRTTWTWAAVAILLAAVAAAGIIWQIRRGHQPQNQQVRTVPARVAPLPAPPSPIVAVRQSVEPQSVQSRPTLVRRVGTDRAGHHDSSWQQATSSSLDEFVALPVSEGLPHATELSVVRVKLRGSDLQQYGLQAPPDVVARTMLAEFVVGEDGLPRAIRIVR